MRYLFASIYRFKKIVYCLLAFNFISLSLAGILLAGTFKIYGPETFQRDIDKPNLENRHFEVSNPDAVYILKVMNGQGLEDTALEKVSSTVLMLNGIQVISPAEFNQQVGYLEKQIELNSSNYFTVEVRGKPGGAITIEIIGIDDAPPTIIANKNPPANANGWNNTNVTVSFTCDDSISGIATCPDPVLLETEGKDQTVPATATDKAGNSKTINVIVNIDKTPPNIKRSWPPDNNFGTDRDSIDIEGEITDSLSGVNSAELHHDSNIIQLDIPFLPIKRTLDTIIPSGNLWKTNGFKLKATDRADNSSEEIFSVRYTLGTTVSPTDPVKIEIINNLSTSFERAIIRFKPSISRDQIHLIVNQEGGRVVGYLPTLNVAIAQFETLNVGALKTVLNNLAANNEVDVATPAIFQPSIEFDNDSLGDNGSAYSNILSSYASQFIIDSLLPINPVNIAVIETGLDVAYGQNNEFDDINFYNLCTPEGLQGQMGIPVDTLPGAHGTKITGILAGANNGSGNNGIIRGIADSQFGVSVFRMNCGEVNDPALIVAALDLIIGGSVGDIDVVNMSFGGIFSDLVARENVRSIYEGYFDSPVGREILWVGGAGNDDQQIECNEFLPSGLACDLDNVISVGAYNSDDLLRGRWISSTGQQLGSNFGAGITLSAPGTNVWTATEPGAYSGVSGTSASTPLVTGAAALMISAYQLSPPIVKQLLVNNTQELNASELPEGGLNEWDFIRAGRIPRIILDGLQWLRDQQNLDGSFSRPATEWGPAEKSVTSTALAATAFSNFNIDESDPDLGKALDWILSMQNADGSISNQGQEFPPKTLDTSFAILALSSTRNPLYYSAIQLATNYLIEAQFNEDTGYTFNSAFYGGWTNYYPDYSPVIDWYSLPLLEPATGMALLALHFAEQFDMTDTIVPAEVTNKADIFLTRCQNYSETNPDFNFSYCFDGTCYFDDGGFTRFPPGNSGPWPEVLGLDSYAGATAAGLLTMYTVGADPLDPRNEPAQVWLGDLLAYASIDDNFPYGNRHFYHYLYYLALAGTAWDWDEYELGDHLGTQVDWYEKVADAIAARQHSDGHFTAGTGETDIDATALAVLALELRWTPAGTGLRFRD